MTIKLDAHMPFAHPVYIRRVVDCLHSLGIRPSAVLANAGLSWQDLCDGHHMVDFQVFRQFVEHAVKASGEPALGLTAGLMLLPYHTPVGIGAVTAATLKECLQFTTRYAPLIFRSLEFELDSTPQWGIVRVKPLRPLCDTRVFVTQSIVGIFNRLLEAILGRHADELSVGLPYSRPPGNEEACLRYILSVEFDQQYLSFRLPAALLDAPSISANHDAFVRATQSCQKMEQELKQGGFVERVRRALLEGLNTNPELAKVATDLGVPTRTLARRLSEAGVTYSDLKDELRRSHAAWYLQHTELSIEAIASQLGYTNTAIFSRKFKCWYRIAPSKMRQSLRTSSH